MAATFVVEDGSGKVDANSYLSDTDADQYWDNHGAPANWTGSTAVQKQEALRLATQYLDARYGVLWLGDRTNQGQALDWPRMSVDDDIYVRESDKLPQELKDACAELALKVRNGDTLLAEIAAEDQEVVQESVKAGPVAESKTYKSSKSSGKRYPLVESLLRPLLMAGEVERS